MRARWKATPALALMISAAMPAYGQSESRDSATSASRAWNAMTCAIFAGMSGQDGEQIRLEQLALSEGRRFLSAARNSAIDREDFESRVPMAFYGRMTGPSVDFALGRVWEAAEDYTGDVLWQRNQMIFRSPDYKFPDNDTIRMRAHDQYSAGNCAALR